MSYLLDHHQAVVDPFAAGHTAQQLGLMMNLTRGGQFPWLQGGVALLRRELYADAHEWIYCGIAHGSQTQVKNYPGMTHGINKGYQYAAAVFLGNGMISQVCEPVRVDFDGNGDPISPRLPMFPVNMSSEALAGGKYRIVWEYDPFGQGASPKDFQVFEGSDAESVDYETPLTDSITGLTTVAYWGNQRIYQFTTGAYGDLTSHVFAVRGRNSNGVAEKNTYTTEATIARVTTPAVAAAPSRLVVKGYSRGAG